MCAHDHAYEREHPWNETHGFDHGPYERGVDRDVYCPACRQTFDVREFEMVMTDLQRREG